MVVSYAGSESLFIKSETLLYFFGSICKGVAGSPKGVEPTETPDEAYAKKANVANAFRYFTDDYSLTLLHQILYNIRKGY